MKRSKLTLNFLKGGKKTEVVKIGAWFERDREPAIILFLMFPIFFLVTVFYIRGPQEEEKIFFRSFALKVSVKISQILQIFHVVV